jgi:DNA-binding response OmpR family regulator
MRLLIVEDDANLASFLTRGLREEGFEVDVRRDGASGLTAALAGEHDLVILDVMLPGADGLTVCRETRAAGVKTPIVILTARASVPDRVAGLAAGADDYLPKPFAFDELVARIHAQLRRTTSYAGHILRVADLELDLLARRAERAGRPIELTAKELALLECFMRHPGQVVSEAEILQRVWGLDFDPRSNIVRVYVHHLRAKVDRDHARKLLHTCRGQGFVLQDRDVS